MNELVQLHPAVLVADGDDRVLDLDQIFALHLQHLFAHFLGVFFGLERNENQIAHDYPPSIGRRVSASGLDRTRSLSVAFQSDDSPLQGAFWPRRSVGWPLAMTALFPPE